MTNEPEYIEYPCSCPCHTDNVTTHFMPCCDDGVIRTPNPKYTAPRVWPFNGYAPGSYMNKCAVCEKQMSGVDKLCFTCLDCAVKGAREIMDSLQSGNHEQILSTTNHFVSYSLWGYSCMGAYWL